MTLWTRECGCQLLLDKEGEPTTWTPITHNDGEVQDEPVVCADHGAWEPRHHAHHSRLLQGVVDEIVAEQVRSRFKLEVPTRVTEDATVAVTLPSDGAAEVRTWLGGRFGDLVTTDG